MKKTTVNPGRRNFLRLLGLAGAGTVVAAAAGPVIFSERFNKDLHQVRQTRTMMGTYVQITVMDESAARAEDAVNNVFAEMTRLENLLTRFSTTSPVAELNASGRINDAPPEMMQVLAAAEMAYKASHGAFDITVLPLLQTVESRVRAGAGSFETAQAKNLVGFEKMSRLGNNVRFDRSGMAITLDGIAKGFIVDRAIDELKSAGIKNALVNAGGDIRALGGKSAAHGWQIMVQDPANKNAYVAKLELRDRAIATSGNYEAYFDNAKLFGHLVSPASPSAPAQSASASILAPNCVTADALATALFVMGKQDGLAMVSAKEQLGALLLDRSGNQHSLRFIA